MAERNDPNRQENRQPNEQFKCGRCGEDFRSERDLRTHEQDQHTDRTDRNTGGQGTRRDSMGQ